MVLCLLGKTSTLNLALLLASTAPRSEALRSLVSEEANQSFRARGSNGDVLRKTFLFCLNTEQQIECDGEKETIEVSTAMYNRNKKLKTEACSGELGTTGRSCDVDAKDMVNYFCAGTRKCHLYPSDHVLCSNDPFYQMRLVIKCSAGEPKPEPARLDCPHEHVGPCITPPPSETTPDPGAMARIAARLPQLPHAVQEYLPENVKELMTKELQSTTTEEPVVIEDVAALQVVKHKVEKEVENPYLEGLSLVPCYRATRWQKLSKGEWFGSWAKLEFLARLTNCGDNEGCFRLNFPHDVVYTDFDSKPTAGQLAQGELFKGADKKWVTFRGTGLQRNDYNTWGICLPKTTDLHYAVTLWDLMRTGKAHTLEAE